jgi:hypothetical protein
MNLETNHLSTATKNLCDAFDSLNGVEKRYAFVNYLSDEEISIIDGFNFNHSAICTSIRPLAPSKAALPDDSDFKFTASLSYRLYKDIKKCVAPMGALEHNKYNYIDQLDILQHAGDADYVWHQDAAKSMMQENNYDFEGNMADAVGFKVALYIKGESTKFIKYDSKVYSESYSHYDSGFSYNIQGSLPQEETPEHGQISIWLTGKIHGAIHRAPDVENSRLFFLYTGTHFSNEHLSGINNADTAEL